MTSLASLDDFLTEKGILTHYFYAQKWNNGELSKEDLQMYAKEYYHLVKAIPGVVSRVRDRAVVRRPDLLEKIDENIAEEKEHIELWQKFSTSLDISLEELESHVPSEDVVEAVSELEELADGSLEDGVTAMYSMELTLPEVAKTKKEGLVKYYGLTSVDAHVYFDEHLNEEKHLEAWKGVEVDAERARDISERSLNAQHKILDGVCKVCGIEMMICPE